MTLIKTRKLIIVVLFFSFMSANSVFANSDAELEELNKDNECSISLRLVADRYRYMAETWFTNPNSEFNLQNNFEVLLSKHETYLKIVDEYASKFDATPDDFRKLAELINRIDSSNKGILSQLLALAKADSIFALSLPSIEDGVLEITAELESSETLCEADLLPTTKQFKENLSEWKKSVSSMRYHVEETSAKRSLLFSVLMENKRITLYKRFAAKFGEDFKEILAKIDNVLAADRLYGKILKFWHNATVVQGIGRGLSTRYLQYSSAINILRSDLSQLVKYRKQLDSLSLNSSSGVKKQIQYDLDLYERQLKNELSKLEEGGWQRVFERQKYLTNKRLEISSRLNSSCNNLVNQYLKDSKGIDSQEEFKTIETLYYQQVKTCSGRE